MHLATTHRLPSPLYAFFTSPLLLALVTLSVCRTFRIGGGTPGTVVHSGGGSHAASGQGATSRIPSRATLPPPRCALRGAALEPKTVPPYQVYHPQSKRSCTPTRRPLQFTQTPLPPSPPGHVIATAAARTGVTHFWTSYSRSRVERFLHSVRFSHPSSAAAAFAGLCAARLSRTSGPAALPRRRDRSPPPPAPPARLQHAAWHCLLHIPRHCAPHRLSHATAAARRRAMPLDVSSFRVEHGEGFTFPCIALLNRRGGGQPRLLRWVFQVLGNAPYGYCRRPCFCRAPLSLPCGHPLDSHSHPRLACHTRL